MSPQDDHDVTPLALPTTLDYHDLLDVSSETNSSSFIEALIGQEREEQERSEMKKKKRESEVG
eukprot:CAMPEP_0201495628 /NCGR_PEP_ID=MMETSP0151_2-20130828/55129_1 /ASSEMBLY_ACC=CAM_ASM_000257 /TAXON_ID=200890 /ORGANISM="Paramoeba atlantica, Strain 621/1 / CCAP 1560/9" /LENGTH=62 /DNA_ID=CAMNT_0047884797 /DNA_START=234 /DNA_END=418 /DNA_ORIENTATION=-